MKLIASLTSPFVRKVRITMAEKNLNIPLVLEDVWHDQTIIHSLNPLGKVPCLILEDESALFDSAVIVDYLDVLSMDNCLIPNMYKHIIKCAEALADGVLDAAILIRLETMLRPESQRSDAWITRQMQAVNAGLQMMNTQLADKKYCVNNQFSLADIAFICTLDWLTFRLPEIHWRTQYANLARFADQLSERRSVKDTYPS